VATAPKAVREIAWKVQTRLCAYGATIWVKARRRVNQDEKRRRDESMILVNRLLGKR
jgi:hypothetical protein